MIDPTARKEIVKNLHSAIDSEMLDQDDKAYQYYIESLLLVVNSLKRDTDICNLTKKDKCNLVEFAKQSIARVSTLLQKEEPEERDETAAAPSAPTEANLFDIKTFGEEEPMLMARYQRRLGLASSAVEKQNLELELAKELVEKAALTRNRLMQATAWAMQSAHKKFKLEEKLRAGRLTESDFKMQQLFALSLQFNQGNSWLVQMTHDLSIYPNNLKLVREVLENVLTDNAHPIKATLNVMLEKVNKMINELPEDTERKDIMKFIDNLNKVIKEDLRIILEVIKALFEPLNTERNSALTSEVIFHVYFSQLKQNLVALIRLGMKDAEQKLNEKIKERMGRNYEMSVNCREAVTKLHYLTTLHNPYDMLSCTVHIIKLLATSDFDKNHCTSIGADDLLPRLCRVILLSGLPSICAEAAFMENFMPAEKALGEEGYAVTMLQSALAHLTDAF